MTNKTIDGTDNTFGSYSTSEVATGYTWIDGKTIYRKCFEIEALPNATSTSYDIGVTVDNVIKMYGWALGSSTFVPLPFVDTGSASSQMRLTAFATTFAIQTGSDRSAFSGYVILEYTKP